MNPTKLVLLAGLFWAALSVDDPTAVAGDGAPSPRLGTKRAVATQQGQASDTKPSRISIRGKVVDEAGAPLANAEVAEIGSPPGRRDAVARSDAAGNFTLDLAPPRFRGWLLAKAKDDGRLGFGNWALRNRAQPVRIVLRKPRDIAVAVIDGKGRPVAAAKVAVVWQVGAVFADPHSTNAEGKAVVRVPAEMPLRFVFAVKRDVGFDYFVYRLRGERGSDSFRLALDDRRPIKFVLGGVHRIRVRVVDVHRRPLAGIGVQVSRLERPNKGGPMFLRGIDEFEATSDVKGFAELRSIPIECSPSLTISSASPDYHFRGQPEIDPAAAASEIEIVADRTTILRVRVAYPDGRPVSGAKVAGAIRYFGGGGIGSWGGTCDENGLSQDIALQQDAYCVVSAESGRFASPVAACFARAGEPLETLPVVVRPAARVHGTLTVGKDRRPIAGAAVCLFQRDDGAYSRLPKDQRPFRHAPPLSLDITHYGTTDERGRFEFFAAPGHYWLTGHTPFRVRLIGTDSVSTSALLDEGANPFEVKHQEEIEIDLHQDRPLEVPLEGRVVLASDRQKGVPGASIQGRPADLRNMAYFSTPRSAADGSFHAKREPFEMLVQAVTKDHLAGIVRVAAEETKITIPVGPAATARGLLVEQATGQPVANQPISYGIRVDFPGRGFTLAFERFTRTDRLGEFELTGLVPGWKFDLYAQIRPPGAKQTMYVHLVDVTPRKPEPIELDEVKLGTAP